MQAINFDYGELLAMQSLTEIMLEQQPKTLASVENVIVSELLQSCLTKVNEAIKKEEDNV